MTSASSMHEAGYPKPVFWDNSEGQSGERGGRQGSGWRGHMYTCGQCMLTYGENHHNIVNIIILQLKLIN